MKIIKTKLEDLVYIEPKVFNDERGGFYRVFCMKEMNKYIKTNFVQFNHSINLKKGTFRGLHYQASPNQETKLVKCIKGAVIDIVIDLRPKSTTYLECEKILLTEKNRRSILIPKDFAHGFITLEDNTELIYFHDEYYNPDCSETINIKDPKLKIKLEQEIKIISKQDLNAKYLK